MHKLSSTLTVRRPFSVLNSGEVPFTVVNMSINGVSCENRGFRILNCYPFRLQPNETYSLDVAYTPDFLTTTNEADLQLYMHMNGSSWLFPLAATVPEDMLARCHRALPRPPFENLMYYSCVTALVFCLVCVLACAYLEGDRAIACAIRQHHAAPRSIFDLNNLGSKKNGDTSAESCQSGNGKSAVSWNDASPSGLHVSADASIILRAFYQAANSVLRAVHFVWRISLLYRDDKQDQPKKESKKKKKTQVSVINSKVREVKEKDKEAMKEKSEPQPSFNTKATKIKQPAQQQTTTNGKKVQPVAPMHKLSAKLSMSPKAPTNNRKKSGALTEADRRLARAQQIIDGDLERPSASVPHGNTSIQTSSASSITLQPTVRAVANKRDEKRRENDGRGPIRHKPNPVPVAPVQQKRSTLTSPVTNAAGTNRAASPSTVAASICSFPSSYPSPTPSTVTSSTPTARPPVIPVSAVHPSVYQGGVTGSESIPIPVMLPVIPTLIPGLTLPISGMDMTGIPLGAFADYYGQVAAYDDSNVPVTPTPSLASSLGNDRTSGLREFALNTEFTRTRQRSESEQSIASELSAAPDWLDEVVGPDDVDDDFSAMAAPSELMLSASGEEGGSSSRAPTPQLSTGTVTKLQQPQKKRARRDKRRRGGRTSGNESASSSEKNYRDPIGAERVQKKSLAAELNEERRRREEEYLRNNNPGGLGDWPMPDLRLGSLIETDERTNANSGLWPPTPIGSRSSLITHWNDHQDSTIPSSSIAPYDPMSLGLSLGTTVAAVDQNAPFNIFAGADFTMWSNTVVNDPQSSWNNSGNNNASSAK